MLKTFWQSRYRTPVLSTLVVVGVLVAGAVFLYRDALVPLGREWILLGWEFVQATPAWFYFTVMGVVTSIGGPISPFYLASAGIYGELQAILWSGYGLFISLSLSYVLATRLARPAIKGMIAKGGHEIPEISARNRVRVTVLFRIAPGLPLVVQSFLLGLGGVPFKPYILVSWPIGMAWAVAFIRLGTSIFEGNVGMALLAVLALIALGLVARILHERYGGKSTEQPDSAGG